MILISMLILALYVLFVLVRIGVPKSLSETYYLLENRGWIFQCVLMSVGLLTMIGLLPMLEGKGYQFLGFIMPMALMFVAVAPKFAENENEKVHMISACMSALSSLLLIALMGYWYIFVISTILIMISYILNLKNRLFWAEIICFATTYFVLMIELK